MFRSFRRVKKLANFPARYFKSRKILNVEPSSEETSFARKGIRSFTSSDSKTVSDSLKDHIHFLINVLDDQRILLPNLDDDPTSFVDSSKERPVGINQVNADSVDMLL